MRRRFRLQTFKKGAAEYLSLRVEWCDPHGAWHSKIVRSYGLVTTESSTQAQADLEELRRLAGDPSDPVPQGTLTDAIWAGFQQVLGNPLLVPLIPLLAARDLAHLGGYAIAQSSGNIVQIVAVTQPNMSVQERRRFVQWLSGFPSADDQASILAYQWMFP